MKKLSAIVLLAILIMGFSSCRKIVGNGPVITEIRDAGEFTAVNFGISGEMIFVPSDHYEILIEAQRNIAQEIETYISGSELQVRIRNNANIKPSEPIRVTVKAPAVNGLRLSGSGTLTVPNALKAAHIKLVVSGSGKMSLNKVEASELESAISGSGNMEVLDGTADHEQISISGSGDVNLLAVDAGKATTHTSGSGSIKVFVQEELETHISGSGDVYYKGTPRVSTHISGSGRVVSLD